MVIFVERRRASGEPTLVHDAAVSIVEHVLALLRERRDLDFAAYRRGTIERRLANRMIKTGVTRGDDYVAFLQGSEDEIDRLAANLTIKVSRFYRNAAVFDVLRSVAIPALRERFAGEPLSVWSAGCAAGEEAYTLAMLLRDGDRVVASDVDEATLRRAAAAEYDDEAFEELPPDLAAAHLRVNADGSRSLSAEARGRVTFLRHDVTSDALPESDRRHHLVCCRNVLIYFSRPLQQRALALLARAVVPGGVLCLGEAEWTGGERSFAILDRANKLFRRLGEEVDS